MPEGDTIAHAALRMRPVLEGHVPDAIRTPHPRHALDHWPERLSGRAVREVRTHGKHLFICFEDELTIHSHLRMTGRWVVTGPGASWGRARGSAWLALERAGHQVVQYGGPVLELMTESRTRFDRRLAELGPDVLAPSFDGAAFLARLRADDPTRAIGDALIDQRNVAGIGNIWKAEGCWEAAIDPWRPLGAVSDEEALAIIDATRPRMLESACRGRMPGPARAYGRAGRPCPRCGTPIASRATGLGRAGAGSGDLQFTASADDGNRITFWCPGCQR